MKVRNVSSIQVLDILSYLNKTLKSILVYWSGDPAWTTDPGVVRLKDGCWASDNTEYMIGSEKHKVA